MLTGQAVEDDVTALSAEAVLDLFIDTNEPTQIKAFFGGGGGGIPVSKYAKNCTIIRN